jgi:hypothetical protein
MNNQTNPIGEFTIKSNGVRFEFYINQDANDAELLKHCPWIADYPHIIKVCDGTSRFCKVLKTVAYVVVDEAPDGGCVVEKWQIKPRKDYI